MKPRSKPATKAENMRKWTEREREFLRNNGPIEGMAWIAKELGISIGSVRGEAGRLGVELHRKSPLERFKINPEKFYIPIPESGCWIWSGGFHPNTGYGEIKIEGKSIGAHRTSYEHFKGLIPNGMYVCHKCDVPLCINPNHLFLGTPKDNLQDASRKGRMPRGEGHKSSKLKLAEVNEIRALLRDGVMTQRAIARKYNIEPMAITRIKLGETWK